MNTLHAQNANNKSVYPSTTALTVEHHYQDAPNVKHLSYQHGNTVPTAEQNWSEGGEP